MVLSRRDSTCLGGMCWASATSCTSSSKAIPFRFLKKNGTAWASPFRVSPKLIRPRPRTSASTSSGSSRFTVPTSTPFVASWKGVGRRGRAAGGGSLSGLGGGGGGAGGGCGGPGRRPGGGGGGLGAPPRPGDTDLTSERVQEPRGAF